MGTGHSKPRSNTNEINEAESYFQSLPPEIVKYMLPYLPNSALGAFSQTSLRNNVIARSLMNERLFMQFVCASGNFNSVKNDCHVTSIVIAPDGNTIVSGSMDGTIRISDFSTGTCIRTLSGHTGIVTCVAIEGAFIISASVDKTVKIWDFNTGSCMDTFFGHKDGVMSVAISKTTSTIVSASFDKTIKIWDFNTGTCIHTLTGHTEIVTCVAIKGNFIISGSWDRTIKIWDLYTGNCIRTLTGHTGIVTCVAIEGDFIISGSRDHTIKIWDLYTGNYIHTLIGHTAVTSVAISPDRDTIVSGCADNTVLIWRPWPYIPDISNSNSNQTSGRHNVFSNGINRIWKRRIKYTELK